MKWLVMVLVIINAAIWWVAEQVPPVHTVSDSPRRLPRVDRLVLMTEYRANESRIDVEKSDSTDAEKRVLADTELLKPLAREDEGGKKAPSSEISPALCYRVVSFDSEQSAERWAEANLGPDSDYRLEQKIRDLNSYHWVIIPPAANRRDALTQLRNLQRRGIDSYLVTEGERVNAISLGIFESMSAAQRVMHQRRREGLDARMVEWVRKEPYWVLFVRHKGVEQPEAFNVLEGEARAVESVSCEGVALENKSP
ncbi:hypothetical protein QQM79_20765 [Marinobacteraceae bacterium S3BR75-40.1]